MSWRYKYNQHFINFISQDFDSMVRRLTLHPLGGIGSISHKISNLQEAYSMIAHDTRYWPLYQSKCCIQHLAPDLKNIISKVSGLFMFDISSFFNYFVAYLFD